MIKIIKCLIHNNQKKKNVVNINTPDYLPFINQNYIQKISKLKNQSNLSEKIYPNQLAKFLNDQNENNEKKMNYEVIKI